MKQIINYIKNFIQETLHIIAKIKKIKTFDQTIKGIAEDIKLAEMIPISISIDEDKKQITLELLYNVNTSPASKDYRKIKNKQKIIDTLNQSFAKDISLFLLDHVNPSLCRFNYDLIDESTAEIFDIKFKQEKHNRISILLTVNYH